MTEDELSQIEARTRRATPGPWRWWTSNSFRRLLSSDPSGKDGDVLSGTIQRSDGHPDVLVSEDDASFIQHAREDVPALVAEVRRLQALRPDISSFEPIKLSAFEQEDTSDNLVWTPTKTGQAVDRLRDKLASAGFELGSANLGRNNEGLFWVFSAWVNDRVITFHAKVPDVTFAEDATIDDVVRRLIAHVYRQGSTDARDPAL